MTMTMKRYFKYLFAAVLACTALACNPEVEENIDAKGEPATTAVFHAVVLDAEEITEIFPGKSKTVSIKAAADPGTGVADVVLTISFKGDPDGVAAYNSAHGTSYEMLPGTAYSFVTNEVMMPRFGTSSTMAKLSLSTSGLEDDTVYLLPVTIDRVVETENWALADAPYAYILVKKAYVAPNAGTGTKEDPFNIYTKADLASMSEKLEEGVKVYFRLQNDIDMTDAKWIPLNFASPYKLMVDFDGNGHTISNFTCDFANYPSFFGVLYGDCYNLTFENATINNEGSNACGIVGAYCGTADLPGSCRNVHVTGAVNSLAGDRGVGGLFGRVHFGTVSDCSFEGTVTGSGGKTGVGGLVGWVNGTIERCWAKAAVVSNANYCGGLVGYDNAKSVIKDCWTSGSIEAPQRAGGIIGGLLKAETEIRNCYSTSSITASFAIGGIGGHCNLDQGSGVLPSATEALYVVENCIAWNDKIEATNDDESEHYSSGAITGYTSTKSYLTNCIRKPDLIFKECATQAANVLYDMPNATPGAPLVKADGTGTYNYPYHGRAAAAGSTVSSVAKQLGWSESVWDFSAALPVLKTAAATPGGNDDTDVNAGGQLPDFDENEVY